MSRYSIIVATCSAFVLSATQIQAQSKDHTSAANTTNGLTITVTKLDISDKTLNLCYEIRNDSEDDVWICDDLGFYWPCNSEIYLTEDNQLVTIRRRLDVQAPSGILFFRRPLGKYVRLCPGKKRYESLSVNLPLDGFYIFELWRYKHIPKNLFYISHLDIEIGYYVGNLPEMMFSMIEDAEKHNDEIGSLPPILELFGDALNFNYFRELLRNRNEEIWIPYSFQQLKGEKVLRTGIQGLRIPCQRRQEPFPEEHRKYRRYGAGPDLKTCTRLEIRYKPSALEYFFPFSINHSLFSSEEVKCLQSEKTFIVEDQNILESFAKEIIRGLPFYGIIRENSAAQFDCYRNNEHQTSITMYGDIIVGSEDKKRLRYPRDFFNVEMFPQEIQKLEYRVQCANNLRNLYHRLRSYNLLVAKQQKKIPVKSAVIYPIPTDWFDALISLDHLPKSVISVFIRPKLTKSHVCPCVDKGRSTYAMNPNCKPDSPPDMVLLFETRLGWNQHGGPELFTFDNHDPIGGCILLNDGTVKFIRTEEELRQLRWK